MTRRNAGFTLIEILVAILLLVIVTGIVYASFASVMNITEQARAGNEALRLRQFLARSFSTNLASVYADLAQNEERFQFIGISGKGSKTLGGVSLDFCSSAPLLGATAPPGMLKVVHYGIRGKDQKTQSNDAPKTTTTLEANETLLVMPAPSLLSSTSSSKRTSSSTSGKAMALEGQASPSWTVPVEAVELMYYDGKEWMEDWDSLAMGRMPWGVRIRINFARSEKEREENPRTLEDGADFELTVPVPLGCGIMTDGSTFANSASTDPQDPEQPADTDPDRQEKKR